VVLESTPEAVAPKNKSEFSFFKESQIFKLNIFLVLIQKMTTALLKVGIISKLTRLLIL
jgi:hypothetical protein|tara:strand:+ start:291 stop:467 length:177 start_codon:yes stop_codon:yes gene_type:complete